MELSTHHNFFSANSSGYRQFRPDYPNELFQYLAMLSDGHDKAWDVATGTGQAAKGLAVHFEKVFASDISEGQLKQAEQKNNIQYFVGSAEQTKIPDASIDIISVAQALHWFDTEPFFQQVDRVLKPGGLLAVWSYQLFSINSEIDAITHRLYSHTLKGYWSPRRKLIETNYQTIDFPYNMLSVPNFYIEKTWSFDQVIGYLNTWSAVKRYMEQEEANPVAAIKQKLAFAWCDTHHMKKIKWPLNLIVCRKPQI
ncbi:MAG: class I SAM-dependent methyltransferase [Kangiellaceae bacterium]|nr:class I SAM-dependent methyltransferase [Kangiellaceae bacterium]